MGPILSQLHFENDPAAEFIIVTLCERSLSSQVLYVQHMSENTSAYIQVETGEMISGDIRPSVHMCIDEWISLHRDEIEAAWKAYQEGREPEQISGVVAA